MMEYLEKTFRWFGPDFGITLNDVKQTGATGVVTALYNVPIGEVWSREEIKRLKKKIESSGLKWSVVESVNVHESIKTSSANSKEYIINYIETLHNLSENGIKTVCYNFMPILDWTRTDLFFPLKNGSYSLRYFKSAIAAFDLFLLNRKDAINNYNSNTIDEAKTLFDNLSEEEKGTLKDTIMAGVPGTRDVFSIEEFKSRHAEYISIDDIQLKKNLVNFHKKVIPEAESIGVKMCIHPDDPPFSIFGLPRVINNISNIENILRKVPSYYNGLTFCSGSLGANPKNNLAKIFRLFSERVHFIHLRNIQLEEDKSFFETDHLNGSINLAEIMELIIQEQLRRYSEGSRDVNIPIRSDHGPLMLGDIKLKEKFYPGYSTIGRMKGLAELTGLELGLRHKICS